MTFQPGACTTSTPPVTSQLLAVANASPPTVKIRSNARFVGGSPPPDKNSARISRSRSTSDRIGQNEARVNAFIIAASGGGLMTYCANSCAPGNAVVWMRSAAPCTS